MCFVLLEAPDHKSLWLVLIVPIDAHTCGEKILYLLIHEYRTLMWNCTILTNATVGRQGGGGGGGSSTAGKMGVAVGITKTKVAH